LLPFPKWKRHSASRNRWFESTSLQQGVRREPDFLVLGCRHSDSTIRVGSRWTAPCRTRPTTISMAVAFTSIPILVGEFMLQNSGDFPPIGRFRCDPVDANQSRNGSVGCDRRPPNPAPSVLGCGATRDSGCLRVMVMSMSCAAEGSLDQGLGMPRARQLEPRTAGRRQGGMDRRRGQSALCRHLTDA
jgi:hypothetical protein